MSELPLRLLVVCPSWVGDAVMATPALRLVRSSLPGCFIGGLVRPGIDQILAGTDFFDEVHVERAAGMMGPKFVAAKVRPRRYDTALLFTNSLSTALIVRIAGIPRRFGYRKDARGPLLTHKLDLPRRKDGSREAVPAVGAYLNIARFMLRTLGSDRVPPDPADPFSVPPGVKMELAVTEAEAAAGEDVLRRSGLSVEAPLAVLVPGGNNPAKRWPEDRFAKLIEHLHREHGLTSLISGAPGESDIIERIRSATSSPTASLAELGATLGALKAILASGRCRIMVANDTGPRHIAAAFGVPVVSLFGPTDAKWTTIPTGPGPGGPGGEVVIEADPTLPAGELSNDHPERCRIERIEVERVLSAADEVLSRGVFTRMQRQP
ncbi:MAG: glycosyltransferase family 9 protein [Phycisphaeraceae bacterium]|nr:glycosyltransferase family 9 protein [Phycisphaeraceae bacterium]